MPDKKIGDLKFGVVVDGKEYIRGTKELKTGTDEFERSVKKASNSVDDMGDKMKKGTKSASDFGNVLKKYLSFAVIIGGITRFTQALFKLGSDLEETQSKFNVVFGGVEEEAERAFSALSEATGRSLLDLKAFGATLGDVFKPLGFTADEALRLSENVTQLAIDVASFNNRQDEEVVRAFTAAITGEREALKTLGIVINEQDVQNEAYTSGIAKQGAELTKQQKALATYNLLLKNSADAQGDAVRTGESFANQLKRLRGAIKDTFANAGREVAQETSGFLATLTTFITSYGEGLIKSIVETGKTIFTIINTAIQGFLNLFNTLDGRTEETGKRQLGLLDILAIGTQTLIMLINTALKGVLAVIQSVGLAIGNILGGVIAGAGSAGQLILEAFKGMAGAVGAVFVSMGQQAVNAIKKIANGAISVLNGLVDVINVALPKKIEIGKISKLTIGEAQKMGDGISAAFAGTKQAAKDFVSDFKAGFGGGISEAVDNFNAFYDEAQSTWLDFGAQIEKSSLQGNKALDSTALTFDDLADLAKKYGAESEAAGGKAKGGANAAEAAYKELSENTKKYLDQISIKEAERLAAAKKNAIEIGMTEEELKEQLDQIQRDALKERIDLLNEEVKTIDDAFKDKRISEETYLKAKEDLTGALIDLSNKLYDKEFENLTKTREGTEKIIDDLSKEYDQWQDDLQKTEDKLKELRDKNEEFMNDISDKLSEVGNDLANLNKSFSEDIAGSFVDAEAQLKSLKDELASEQGGDSPSQDRIANIQEEIKAQEELIKTVNDLKQQGLVSDEQISEARRQADLNDIQKKVEAFEKEKEILEERQALLKAIQEGEVIDLEAIQDFKNKQLAEELLVRQAQIQADIELVKEQQIAITNAWMEGAQAIEQVNDQLIAVLDAKYQALADRIRSALESARSAGGGGGGGQLGGFANNFQDGGFTGLAPTDKVKGVVHGGEFVANARLVRDNKSLFAQLDKIQRKGYQDGGIVTNHNERSVTINPTIRNTVSLRHVLNQARFHLR